MPEEEAGPLGQKVSAPEQYDPAVLFPVPRARGRSTLPAFDVAAAALPFQGWDSWNCYEASWLDTRGLPTRHTLRLQVDCRTPNLVESKSLKLYLNSLNFRRFNSEADALATIRADVGAVVGKAPGAPPLVVELSAPFGEPPLDTTAWKCIDDGVGLGGELSCDVEEASALRCCEGEPVSERLVTHLLRTLCPVTGQPDWGSVLIEYTGAPIDRTGLLRYIVSLRREVGFHEVAIERIFLALRTRCAPTELTVTGRFLRRGGIDINPVRSTSAPTSSTMCRVPGQ